MKLQHGRLLQMQGQNGAENRVKRRIAKTTNSGTQTPGALRGLTAEVVVDEMTIVSETASSETRQTLEAINREFIAILTMICAHEAEDTEEGAEASAPPSLPSLKIPK